jgi:hypothetical protein
MKQLIILFFALLFSFSVFSQNNSEEKLELDYSTLAFGWGLGYGSGVGFSYTAFPQKNIGLFAAGGVIWGSFGYNLGVKARLISDKKQKKVNPYLIVMYGTNASFVIENRHNLNKNFYGLSYGAGLDFGFKGTSTRKAYWSISVLLPIINEETKNYHKSLKGRVEPEKIVNPEGLTFAIGYNMIFGKK